jgi:AAA ATPase domain/AAA domain, putative AbiEii toxin, Type IV TA system
VYISNLRIRNFKSFLSSPDFAFVPGFNLIVGANNVGKTALVEALSLQFNNKPHLTLKTAPHRGRPIVPFSEVELSVHLEAGETEALILDNMGNFYVPVGPEPNYQEAIASFTSAIRGEGSLKWHYQVNNVTSAQLQPYGQHADANANASVQSILFMLDTVERTLIPQTGLISISSGQTFAYHLANVLRNRIYVFKAERFKTSDHPFGPRRDLLPDAFNLPEVLHNLEASDPEGFRILNEHVRTVFPDIHWVAIPSNPGGGVRILLWPIETRSRREDLAIPLADSGTGVGQVLAMLYVVVDAKFPQTIVIDEPQSFLHPGAIRKLVDILK